MVFVKTMYIPCMYNEVVNLICGLLFENKCLYSQQFSLSMLYIDEIC